MYTFATECTTFTMQVFFLFCIGFVSKDCYLGECLKSIKLKYREIWWGHVLIFYVLANFIIMIIIDFSLEKFMLTNPLVRVINSALVTSLLFDFLHFAFKSFACFTARFLVSNRRKRNVTRRACKIKRTKTEPFFQCGWASFLAVWKEGNFKNFIFTMSFQSFLQ